MNNHNTIAYNDEFTRTYIEDYLLKGSKLPFSELIQSVENEIEQAIKNNKIVIFKDTADFTINYFVDILTKWKSKFNIKFIYLLRHPKAAYISYKNKMEHELSLKRLPEEFIKERLDFDYFTPMLSIFHIFGGKVIISEELQEHPKKVFREVFDFCGLDYNENLLTFKPLVEEGIPKRWEFFSFLYDDCYSSTTLRSSISDVSQVVIEDNELIEKINIREEIYNKFVEERKNYIRIESGDDNFI